MLLCVPRAPHTTLSAISESPPPSRTNMPTTAAASIQQPCTRTPIGPTTDTPMRGDLMEKPEISALSLDAGPATRTASRSAGAFSTTSRAQRPRIFTGLPRLTTSAYVPGATAMVAPAFALASA